MRDFYQQRLLHTRAAYLLVSHDHVFSSREFAAPSLQEKMEISAQDAYF